MMRDVDLEDAIAGSMLSTAADREKEYLALFELNPPFWFSETVPPRRMENNYPLHQTGKYFKVWGSAGTATGTAKVILDPTDPTDFEPGDILVAPITDPLGHHYLCLPLPLLLMSAPQ